ncbi:MAG: TMEM175 family protein [Flavobacteriaceae bacterium]
MKLKHNISRIEAFSDAVFAVAATLMVVSFDMDETIILHESNILNFATFGISFFVLVGLWWVHYNFFRRTDYMDNWIIAFNAMLLFVILYYVFPLKSLITTWFGKERLSIDGFVLLFELYSLGFALIFLFLSLMYYRAYRKTKDIESSIDLLFYSRHFAIYVLVACASVLVAKFQIGLKFVLPGIIYALLGPLCYWHGLHFKKKFKTLSE